MWKWGAFPSGVRDSGDPRKSPAVFNRIFNTPKAIFSTGDRMLEIMKCNLCGKLAMIIRDGGKRTICCDQLMEQLMEQGAGAHGSNHVPVIEKWGNGVRVKVPGFPAEMKRDHFLEWIEVTDGKKLQVMGLVPGDAPEATFGATGPGVKSRAYCEHHGLWSNRPSKGRD
jgi:superoxide reductase